MSDGVFASIAGLAVTVNDRVRVAAVTVLPVVTTVGGVAADGVWDKLQQMLLDKLRHGDQLDFSRAVVDSSHAPAKWGRSSPTRSVRVLLTGSKRARNITCSPTPIPHLCRTSSRLTRPIGNHPAPTSATTHHRSIMVIPNMITPLETCSSEPPNVRSLPTPIHG